VVRLGYRDPHGSALRRCRPVIARKDTSPIMARWREARATVLILVVVATIVLVAWFLYDRRPTRSR